MKLLHLIYSQQVAGAERYLLNLLPGIRREGIDCRLICVTGKSNAWKFTGLIENLKKEGVEAQLITSGRIGFLATARKISKYVKQHGVTHIHSHLFSADILGVMVKKLFFRRIILLSTRHGYEEKYLLKYAEEDPGIPGNIYYRISKYILSRIDVHIAVSKAMADMYYQLRLVKTPIEYIHHGVNIDRNAIRSEETGTTNFRVSACQLIIVGRLEEIKGHKYLLDAMPAVIKQVPEVKLLVLGAGTEMPNLEQQVAALGISEHVKFMGYQADPYHFVSHSDVIILPSLFEPFGLVYIEAFALGTPVIAFDTAAGNEIITNNETGILVPKQNSAELANKIIFLLQYPQERKRLSDAALKKYQEQFSVHQMINKTVAWYYSIN
jgi:glycosyltransferase involved in cell wall biosynthesis